ncbi:MAG: DEAD/DEAH box helicase, partial [Sphingomonas sp.]
LLIGGVQMGDQVKALADGVDVLIATPGRLMDLFGRGKILLTGCSLLVIDEADRMLDMGFIPDIEEICTKLPKQRQTLLFSATMPPPIKKLADRFLDNPKRIEVARPASTNINITQWVVPVKGSAADKRARLRQILGQEEVTNAIVFCNRKTTVRELNKSLKQHGFKSGEIHGDMEQSQRIAELDLFKDGHVSILVASDVAARGLDIKGVSTVVNFDAPWHPDDYVHRIGRTGRAGATGTAYTMVGPDDVENIDNIEKLTGQKIQRLDMGGPQPAEDAPEAEKPKRGDKSKTAKERKEKAPAKARGVDKVEQPAPAETAAVEPEARAARDERPRREERPERFERDERQRRDDRPHGRSSRRRDGDDDGPDVGWNGPIPEFLNVTFAVE